MQQLISSGFQIGGDASAAAGPVGRHASADTNWKLETEILTYSRARGAFAGITLTGASIRRDDDSMRAIYGRRTTVPARYCWEMWLRRLQPINFLTRYAAPRHRQSLRAINQIVSQIELRPGTMTPRRDHALDNFRNRSGAVAAGLQLTYRWRIDSSAARGCAGCSCHQPDIGAAERLRVRDTNAQFPLEQPWQTSA